MQLPLLALFCLLVPAVALSASDVVTSFKQLSQVIRSSPYNLVMVMMSGIDDDKCPGCTDSMPIFDEFEKFYTQAIRSVFVDCKALWESDGERHNLTIC